MAEQWRLFVAIDLTERTRGVVRAAQAAARDAGFAARWIEPSSAHLTLKFLGDTDHTLVAPLCATLRGIGAHHSPFSLRTGSVGAFPNERHPRVLWLGLAGDLAPLLAVQRAIDTALVPLGFPREARPFRPHLTLGRPREGGAMPPIGALATAQGALGAVAVSFPVTSILLIRSELGRGGARYTTLCTLPLASACGSR